MTFAEYLLDNIFLPRLQERRVLVVFDPQKRYLEICQQLQSEQCRVLLTEARRVRPGDRQLVEKARESPGTGNWLKPFGVRGRR